MRSFRSGAAVTRVIGAGSFTRQVKSLELYLHQNSPDSRQHDSHVLLDRGTAQSRIGVISLCRVVSTSEPNSFTGETGWTIFDAWIAARYLKRRIWILFLFMMRMKKRSRKNAALE